MGHKPQREEKGGRGVEREERGSLQAPTRSSSGSCHRKRQGRANSSATSVSDLRRTEHQNSMRQSHRRAENRPKNKTPWRHPDWHAPLDALRADLSKKAMCVASAPRFATTSGGSEGVAALCTVKQRAASTAESKPSAATSPCARRTASRRNSRTWSAQVCALGGSERPARTATVGAAVRTPLCAGNPPTPQPHATRARPPTSD